MPVSQWRATLDFLRRRKQNYQMAFSSPAGLEVLSDLSKFCRANETCFDPDPRLHAVAEGRREVFLRIQKHLNLSAEQLHALYAGKPIPFNQQKDDTE
jgi:hypothetical protein